MSLVVIYWLVMTFLVGTIVGSFLNVAVSRLPKEKSLIWPGSRCGACHQTIRWYHNLPIVSYLWLRGRCARCGTSFSPRYLIVELVCGIGFSLLYYVEMVLNIHGWPVGNRGWALAIGFPPPVWWWGYLFHALLFSFLLAAAVCDLDGMEIPLPLTLTGTVIGLLGAVLFPWPWPWTPAEATPVPLVGMMAGQEWKIPGSIKEGIYAWPVYGPLPEWLAPGGNWQTGLATGVAGALAGTFLVRAIAFVFSAGLGKEALGLGDADLMMMAGAFLGWQMVVVAFFVSVLPGLFFGIAQMVLTRDNRMPFGPSLAVGVMATCVGWHGWALCAAPDVRRLLPGDRARAGRSGHVHNESAASAAARESVLRSVFMAGIVIVDYGMANLRSVQKAFERFGHAADISGDPDVVAKADKLVLPGVGAFRDAIARLVETGLDEPIRRHAQTGKPFFGICLGFQLLFTTSHEDGVHKGLDLFPGEVVRFDAAPGLKVPHMGWNQLRVKQNAPHLRDFPDGGSVYFVHSYYVVPRDQSLACTETDYPTPFTSSIWLDNVFATQFHPEKSQSAGLSLLKNFAEL